MSDTAIPDLDLDFDPARDLHIARTVPVPAAAMFAAWTEAARLKPWFCPAPWRVADCRVDARPGGELRVWMAGPDGERAEVVGCWLLVEPHRRLVWTTRLGPGFRPTPEPEAGPSITADIRFTPVDGGAATRYVAVARHRDAAGCQAHADMGFEAGWNLALDQLVTSIRAGG